MDYQQQNNHQPQGLYGSDDNYQNSFGQQAAQGNIDVESQAQAKIEQPEEDNSAQQKQVGCCGFLTVEYIIQNLELSFMTPSKSFINNKIPFFNVTSTEVKKKIINVFLPKKPEFQNKKNPDLWGPFWILTTVIFLLCSCGNLSDYISNQNEEYIVQFNFAPAAAGLIYGVGIGFPILLSILIKCLGGDTSPIEAICLYGYSMACFAVVAALSTIPFGWLQWILTIYGFLNSTIFIVINIYGDISSLPAQKKYAVLGVIGAFQIAFMLSFKLFFFSVFKS